MKLLVAFVVLAFPAAVACSSGSDSKGQGPLASSGGAPGEDGGAPGGSSGADAGKAPLLDDYNMDCSTARWGNVSAECWSCMCDACTDTLNACNGDCAAIFRCAQDNQTLVNKIADISCEIRATGLACLQTPEAQAATQPLLDFDTCLIGSTKKKPGEFRACDTVCGTPYPGDVCERYPLPSSM